MRPLRRIPVPPGAAGVAALAEPLQSALDGTGPAIAPVPTTSVTVSSTLVSQVLAALRPDDPHSPLESDDVAVVLATSGSTGAPRGVLLTAEALGALGPQTTAPGAQWIAALPVTSMGGFNVLVRAAAAGREPVVLPSIGGAAPFTAALFTDAVHVASRASADVRVSLVAAQVRRLLEDPAGTEALRACGHVLVGGGRLPAELRDQARAAGITLTSTYGSTETSGGCVYDGRPLDQVTAALDASGEVVLAGPMLALGYRRDPGLTAERFTAAGYRTGDLGTLDADGRLAIIGRADDVVVVKGVNVSLGAVERAAESVPGVRMCTALSVEAADGEPQVIVLMATNRSVSRARVHDAIVERLGAAARPARVARVTELPLLANGKVDRVQARRDVIEGAVTWLQ